MAEIPEITITTVDGFEGFPERGLIKNLKTGYCNKTGEFVGNPNLDGYYRFWLNNKNYSNHRYIYETYHGVKLRPDQEINHINNIPGDNGIDNLEIVTQQQNKQWRDKPKNNTSGYKGVSWIKRYRKWSAYIPMDGKQIYIGYFDNKEDAARAYLKKAEELNRTTGAMFKLYDV
ncbi:hypothetical protein DFS34DRAFT_590893 [Phlyctochytrium arcticum]|nr:hypothetical protein DFS34DRAFT_590893 [Phlyctochytrium arcticum]